jgi:tetratricopeptide (TPR) repeat protein
MAKSTTKSTGPIKKADTGKTAKTKAVSKKAPARTNKLSRADLDEMFKAAVADSENFQVNEDDDYGKAIEHFNKVISLLDAIIAIDPNYRNAVNYKGMMLYGCGNVSGAIECFNSILALNPADKEALNNKGIALYGLGKDEDALKCVEAALELDKRYADAYANKAVILAGLGRLEEADMAIKKARALDLVVG